MNPRLSILATALALLAAPVAAQDIVALCIGNNAYHKPDDVLDTPVADATLMRDTLLALEGVRVRPEDVMLVTDATRLEMGQALRSFKAKAAGAKLALVFYSGHGMEDTPVGETRPETFLLPVDADITSLDVLPELSVPLGDVLKTLEGTVGARAVILDCCRTGAPSANRALARAGKNAASLDADVKRALGAAVVPEGTLIAFAAGPGRKAAAFLERSDDHSPFTRFLAEQMRGGGGDLLTIVNAATRVTKERTENRQVPHVEVRGDLSLLTDFVIGGGRKANDGEVAALRAELEAMKRAAEQGGTMARTDPVGPGAFPADGDAATRLRAATKETPFVNTLGLEFVPVPGREGVWMARTETRVRDFEKFVEATTYDATEGAFTLESGGWKQAGGSWKDPRFPSSAAQTPDHPVVCVSWEDARAFCAWLGSEEKLRYRLPTDEEWSLAAGQGKYPWGNQFPPPRDGGNYAGAEANTGAYKANNYPVIANFNDGSARTSRVGQYAENRFGFFDLGGNVWEWCEDPYRASMNDADALEAYPFLKEEKDSEGTPYRVLRGGSWSNKSEVILRCSGRDRDHPSGRDGNYGFRLVVSVGVGG